MNDSMILALISGIIGSFIGGVIAACGSVYAVKLMEEYRRSERLKNLLRDLLRSLEVGKFAHPSGAIENNEIDNAVADLIAFLPLRIRGQFKEEWEKYRYEPKGKMFTIPLEYTELSTDEVKKIISCRLNYIISLLE